MKEMNFVYIKPDIEPVELEPQGFIAQSSLENPVGGDNWGWN